MPGMRIRAARAADDAVLAELDRASWSWSTDVTEPPTGPPRPFFDEAHPLSEVLVAEDNGVPVGYVRLAPVTSLPSTAHVQQVRGLAVAPIARGRGIGALLIDAVVDLARERGARKVSLRVLATNPGARRLYERAGFIVEGMLRGEFERDGAYVDDVLMARLLN